MQTAFLTNSCKVTTSDHTAGYDWIFCIGFILFSLSQVLYSAVSAQVILVGKAGKAQIYLCLPWDSNLGPHRGYRVRKHLLQGNAGGLSCA